ncbi:MAG: outer membrane protein assembly factor BamD [Porphyromonadaceae bacterium]|nr:MAG: outer membrane protein assembly factor BamD [Porphyromonadaceae bacterium]
MNRYRLVLVPILLLILLNGSVHAQQSAIYRDQDADLKEGLELFHKSQFGAAQLRFTEYLRRTEGQEATSRADAAFYQAICAIQLDHDNGESLVEGFLEKYPESSKANLARFEMGKVLFVNKKFKRASGWLQQVKIQKLATEYHTEYQFYSAYCFFVDKAYKKAQPLFEQVMNADGDFREAATYYYYYAVYQDKNYDKALKGFLGLKTSKEFGNSSRFYVAQIYYAQEKFDEVIALASPLVRNAKPDQQNEMARIIGDSYFRLNRFAEAIPYLEQYRKGTKTITRDEHYALGYAYYMNHQNPEAIKELELISDANDLLTQSSNHLLGGILVEMNDKLKARSAFRKAASLTLDKTLQEEALLNYAKLNFDLSISGETLRAFEEFLSTFPDSKYQDEVYDYMVKVFMNTRNYQEALVALDKIKNKNPEVRKAYQRIAYYRALELLNNLKYREAIDLFDRSLEYGNYDDHIRALCFYWQGEAWYNIKAYDKAAVSYDRFLNCPGANKMPEYQLAQYGMGYAWFNQENYVESANWFRRFTGSVKKQDKLMADAYNRIGDCYFMGRTYWQAIEYYDKAVTLRTEDAGYAIFQKGFSLGLVKKSAQKIEVLNKLLKDYPKSPYIDDALYEIGRSYIDLNQPLDAIQTFKDLINKYPNSSYVRKSYVQLGLIYFNSNRNEEAMAMYKKVVSTWPDSQESVDALNGLKNIYVDNNQVDEYLTYVQSTGRITDISLSQQDSLVYQAAENLYMQGNCEKAMKNLEQYIARFPQGQFVLNAHYYIGDCTYRANELDKALSSYSFILARGRNEFSEVALARTGEISYQQSNFDQALVLYQQLLQQAEVPSNILDARIGIMRCSFKQKDYATAIQSAKNVLSTDKVPEEIVREASYKLGKAYMETGDQEKALDVLSGVARDVKNVEGAESKYLIADIMFRKGQVDQAEKEILEFLDQNTTHQYWLAKAYILWSEIYLKRGDLFQAKATLQILKENYTRQDDGIMTIVDEKLKWIATQNQEK